MNRRSRLGLPGSLMIAALGVSCVESSAHAPRERPLIVFAAASTAEVISPLCARFERDTGHAVRVNAAASSTLAQQIAAGAPCDVFLSANARWMDFAVERGCIDAAQRRDLLGNALVLIHPRADAGAFVDPLEAPRTYAGRVALGDPEHVPAGIYAAEALRSLGVWDSLQPRLVFAMDARAAVRFVEFGEVEAGIVYATDAALTEAVEVVRAVPSELHEPIVYPLALARGATSVARQLYDYLGSADALAAFRASGFRTLAEPVRASEVR